MTRNDIQRILGWALFYVLVFSIIAASIKYVIT